MKRGKKIALIAAVSVAAVLLVLVIVYNVLLSGYAIRNWWLPLAEEKAGIKVTAEKASVSLFGSRTLVLEGVRVSKPGELDASVGKLLCEAEVLSFVFGSRPLTVNDLEIDDVQVRVTPAAAGTAEKQAESASSGEKKQEPAAEFTLPVAVKTLRIARVGIVYAGASGEVAGTLDELKLTDLAPGETVKVTARGGFSGAVNQLTLSDGAFELNLSAGFPEKGLPENALLAFDLSTRTAAPGLEATPVEMKAGLNLAREGASRLKLDQTAIELTSGGAELGKVELAADWDIAAMSGKASGKISAGRSAKLDGLVSAMAGKDVKELSLALNFDADLDPASGKLAASGDFALSAQGLPTGDLNGVLKVAGTMAASGDALEFDQLNFNLKNAANTIDLSASLIDNAPSLKLVRRDGAWTPVSGGVAVRMSEFPVDVNAFLPENTRLGVGRLLLSLNASLTGAEDGTLNVRVNANAADASKAQVARLNLEVSGNPEKAISASMDLDAGKALTARISSLEVRLIRDAAGVTAELSGDPVAVSVVSDLAALGKLLGTAVQLPPALKSVDLQAGVGADQAAKHLLLESLKLKAVTDQGDMQLTAAGYAPLASEGGAFMLNGVLLGRVKNEQLTARFDLEGLLERVKSSARLDKLALDLSGDGAKGSGSVKLARPVTLSWGSGVQARDIDLAAALKELDIVAWAGLAGMAQTLPLESGDLSLDLAVKAAQWPGQVAVQGALKGGDLVPKTGASGLKPFALDGEWDAVLAQDLKSVQVNKLNVNVAGGVDNGSAAVALKQPATLSWGGEELQARNAFLTVKSSELDIPALLQLAGKAAQVPVKSGLLALELEVAAPAWPGEATTRGSFALKQFSSQIGAAASKPVDLAGAWDVAAGKDLKSFRVGKFDFGGDGVGNIAASGTFNLAGDMDFQAKIAGVTEALPAALPLPAVQELKIRKLRLNGDFAVTKQNVKGQLKLTDLLLGTLENPVGATLDCAASLNGEVFTADKLALLITEGARQIADLAVSGSYDRGSGQPLKLAVASQSIDAQALQRIAGGVSGQEAEAAGKPQAQPKPEIAGSTQAAAEPAPLDLARVNGSIAYDFRKIVYGDGVTASLKGNTAIQGNAVTSKDTVLTLNQAPVSLSWKVDAGVANGYPFEFALDLSKLDIVPLALLADIGAKGTVDKLTLNATGRGFTMPNIKQYLNMVLNFSTTDVGFQVQSLEGYVVTRVIVDVLNEAMKAAKSLAASQTVPELTEFVDKLSRVLNGDEYFETVQGSGRVRFEKGVLLIDSVNFNGGTFKRETITGSIDLNTEAVKLDLGVNFGALVLPLSISGTLSEMKADYARMVAEFGRQNITEALKPENIQDTADKVKDIINIFR